MLLYVLHDIIPCRSYCILGSLNKPSMDARNRRLQSRLSGMASWTRFSMWDVYGEFVEPLLCVYFLFVLLIFFYLHNFLSVFVLL